MNTKFETIIESYLNGNISWVREQVKKLNKAARKELYSYVVENIGDKQDAQFFFNLI